MSPLLRRASVLGLATALTGGAVLAAEPADVALSYTLLKIDDGSRHGGAAALSFHAFGSIRLWADIGLARESAGSVDLTTTTLMAGPGLRFGGPRTRLFVRALGGIVKEKASIQVLDAEIAEWDSVLGVLAGGGVDFKLSGRLSLRVQGDYLWRDAEGGDASGLRGGAGFVYRFGQQ